MSTLLILDKLQAGNQYTFHFQAGVPVVLDGVIPGALTVAYSFVQDVKETHEFFGNGFAVTFTWIGLPTTVGDVAGQITQVLGAIAAPTFVYAEGGDVAESGSPAAIFQPIADAGASITDKISGFFGGLKTATISILIAIVAIVVLVLILAAYGPNVKHIAGAFA